MSIPVINAATEMKVIDHLGQFISDHKKAFIERVLNQRTRYVTIVLEDIYQSQNASAVIRTCECLGVQDVHIIETKSSWSTNKKVLKGSHKWLDFIRYSDKKQSNITLCYEQLRNRGYRIAVTDPSPDGLPIGQVPLDKPVALVMGNELEGSTPYALQEADLKVHIPMHGFTESFNISVSAAICLHTLLSRLRESNVDWRMSEKERQELRLKWYRKIVRRSDLIEQEFLRSIR